MGPYVFVNVLLIGFFAFAALHYFWMWLLSRHELVLLVFAIHCALCSALGACIVGVITARTVHECQAALDARASLGLAAQVTTLWLLTFLTGVHARPFVLTMSGFLLALAAINGLIFPITGTVTTIENVRLPWGEEGAFPHFGSPRWWTVPILLGVIAVHLFGLSAARRMWPRDRIGGILVAVASAGTLCAMVAVALIEVFKVGLVYIGLFPLLGWVVLIALSMAREYRMRGDKFAASDAERKAAKETLKTSEATLRSILETASDHIMTTDRQGKILFINRTLPHMTVAEVIGTSIFSHAPAPAETELRIVLDRVFQTGATVEFETQGPSMPDGQRGYWLTRVGPVVNDKEVVAAVFCAIDIRARKEAEDASREAHQFNQQIIASAQHGLIVIDRAYRYRVWNPKMEEISGLRAADVLGKQPLDLFPFLRETGVLAQVEQAMAGETVISADFPYEVPGSGRKGWSMQIMGPLRDSQGVIAGAIVSVVDVTERKKAVENSRNLEMQLLQSQKTEAIGQLAGGVAHDFNNLLTVILGFSEVVLEKLADHDELVPSVRAIKDAGERGAALTRQLLVFSRRHIFDFKLLDLNCIVTETETMLRRLIREDIEFLVHLDRAVGRVRADPTQLGQVLINLVVNARDAMPNGGRLTIQTRSVASEENGTNTPSRNGHAGWVLLTVTDTGIGMQPETLARIFEPFFTTKDVGQGTGLGLAVVQGIVEKCGGRLDVASKLGIGSTFSVYLPTCNEAIEPDEPMERNESLKGTETILLVEDEQAIRNLACRALEAGGYRVLLAADGRQALHLAEQHANSIDMLLTDVVMPNLSGVDLAKVLRTKFPSLKILFMTGYSDDEIFQRGLTGPDFQLLQKPYAPTTLIKKIRYVLDRDEG